MTTPQTSVENFESFNLHEKILKGVTEAGFITPSQIQKEAIPVVLAGKDLIAQAQTGTGKTAAFGLPAMSLIADKKKANVELLVITPTRELAAQVSDELFRLGKFADLRTVAVYGGQSIQRQVDLIERGTQIVVATPGRLLDHLSSGRLKNFKPSVIVLDEADEMLDMGFLDDVKAIFEYFPHQKQTLLFSATMPPAIKKLAQSILKEPAFISVMNNQTTNKDIEQLYYVIEEYERKDAVIRLIDSEDVEKAIIFCRTKIETDELSHTLQSRGYGASPLHGDMEQSKRQTAIRMMQAGKIDILVATDVAARGLDITGLSHVFNYHMPFNSESYVHRIGRTGRAGNKGKAITLVTPGEYRKLCYMQRDAKLPLINRSVPSVSDVHRSYFPKLAQSVLEQVEREESIAILGMLEGELDHTQIATKLISMLLDQRPITGPDQIGVKGEKLKRLLTPGSAPKSPSKSPYGGSGRSFDKRSNGSGRSNAAPRDRERYPSRDRDNERERYPSRDRDGERERAPAKSRENSPYSSSSKPRSNTTRDTSSSYSSTSKPRSSVTRDTPSRSKTKV
ncbi:MAG: hypothetical protein K0S74_137 [Chlamydiales bacterium]|jgi:ATP-dependent RNA helicase DeaD|nr:hypothetical protein [Chlamydiales bacterium]